MPEHRRAEHRAYAALGLLVGGLLAGLAGVGMLPFLMA